MKTSQILALFVGIALLVTCVALLFLRHEESVVGASTIPVSVASSTGVLDTALKDPCKIENRPDGGKLRSFGCGVLYYLVTQDILNPKLEKSWYTKCDLNATLCAPGEKQDIAPAPSPQGQITSLSGANGTTIDLSNSQNASPLLIRLLRSAKLPLQLTEGTEAVATAQASSPPFASILFNDVAANAMRAPDGTPRSNVKNGSAPVFQPGSVIAKLVWGVYPVDDSGKILTGTEVFASSMKYSQQDSWISKPGNGFTLPNAKLSATPRSDIWIKPPFSKSDFGADCAKALKHPNSDLPFSPDCMYFISTSPNSPHAITSGDVLNADSLNGTAIGIGTDCLKHPCRVVLLGIHLMVRISNDNSLRTSLADSLQVKSPWVFMTFWWTGKGDGLCSPDNDCLPKPWNNYQMNISQDFRADGGASSPFKDICYSPYLEGFKFNGAATNCVHCHYYAAYKQTDGTSLVQTGNQIGFNPPPSLPRSPTKIGCASNTDYPGVSDAVVCTDFVWSVANIGIPPSK